MKSVLSNPFFIWMFRLIHPDIGISLGKYFSQKNKLISGKKDLSFKGEENEWLIGYCKRKLDKEGLFLRSRIIDDIKDTMKLLNNL